MKREKLYYVWTTMKYRCKNKENYKDRGIEVCKEWNSYDVFLEWALNNGYKEGLSIDRINNDGNYEPQNCRWTTQSVQARNTRLLSKKNKTGYRGVLYAKDRNAYRVKINGKYIATVKCRLEGAYIYDQYIRDNNLENPKNFE